MGLKRTMDSLVSDNLSPSPLLPQAGRSGEQSSLAGYFEVCRGGEKEGRE